MSDGEFSFEMVGTSDNAKDMKATGVNAAAIDGEAGSVALSPITFKEPGTYEFQIREVNNKLGGVDYDASTLTAKAEVSSDGAGKMLIEWAAYDADGNEVKEFAFENEYKAKETSLVLGSIKTMKGRALKDGEFTFQLKDEDGNVVSEAKNAEDGWIAFETLVYDQAGTYRYTISEVKGNDETITYDETVYNVTVEVNDDLKGHLDPTVTYEDSDGAPVFVNTYTEPADDGDDVGIFGVKTGDPAETAILLTIMGVALAVIVAMSMILIRRRRR